MIELQNIVEEITAEENALHENDKDED